jgi:transposase-like protein
MGRINPSLTEGDWPYLWIGATCVKVHDNGRIDSTAVIVAVGANADGRSATATHGGMIFRKFC